MKSTGDAVHLAASNPVIGELTQGVGEQGCRPPVKNLCLYLPRNILGEQFYFVLFNSLFKQSQFAWDRTSVLGVILPLCK